MKLHKNYTCLDMCKNCEYRVDYDYDIRHPSNNYNNYYFCKKRLINFDKHSFEMKYKFSTKDCLEENCVSEEKVKKLLRNKHIYIVEKNLNYDDLNNMSRYKEPNFIDDKNKKWIIYSPFKLIRFKNKNNLYIRINFMKQGTKFDFIKDKEGIRYLDTGSNFVNAYVDVTELENWDVHWYQKQFYPYNKKEKQLSLF